jgi:phage FluMu gp28-like protein
VHVETMKRTDGEGLAAMIDRAFARYKLKRLCIDSTGLGTFPSEAIKKKHSEKIDVAHRRPRVECIDFTPNSKEQLATGLYTTMSNQLVQLPSNDNALPCEVAFDPVVQRKYTINAPGTAAALKREIASVQRIVTTSGNVTYSTPRTSDGHADRAWALMLALHARSATNPMIDALRSRMAGGTR